MTRPVLYAESPMDPLWIGRHLAGAGLAFEKHRFGFPSRSGTLVSPFEYGAVDEPARAEVRVDGLPIAASLPAIALSPLHVLVAHDPDLEQGLVARYLTGLDVSLVLTFRNRPLPPVSTAPRTIGDAVAEITGAPVVGAGVQAVSLDTPARRLAALQAFAGKAGPYLYLLAAPAKALLDAPPALFEDLGKGAATISFSDFHALVAACSWVMTTHRRLADEAPFVFYSARELPPELVAGAAVASSLAELPRHEDAVREQVGVEANLAGVVELSLAGSPVTNLEALIGAPDLRVLDLDHTAALDEESLPRLTMLESLSLRGHWLRDGRRLAPLTRLRRLVLDLAPRAGSETLAGLVGLESLAIERQPLGDLAFAARLSNLRDLIAEAAPDARDFLAPLRGLPALTQLEARGRAVVDLRPLARLPLKELRLGRTGVTDLAPLAATDTLQDLELPQTDVVDLSALLRLPALRRLNLFQTRVEDLALIAGMASLAELALGGVDVIDMAPLAPTRLRTLDVHSARIPSLAPLSMVQTLTTLRLRYCELPPLGPLASLPALEHLDLSGSTVDLTDLPSLATLRTLVIDEGRLPDAVTAQLAPRVAITAPR